MPHTRSLFGTDGIRGLATDLLFSSDHVRLLAYAAADLYKHISHPDKPVLVIHDTRTSAFNLVLPVLKGIAAAGMYGEYGGMCATPIAMDALSSGAYSGALILSASHNPATYVGIKCAVPTRKLTADEELRITHTYYQLLSAGALSVANKPDGASWCAHDRARSRYMQSLKYRFGSLSVAGMRIALDGAHGAHAYTAQEILEACGATVIARGNEPNGYNINERCGATHPEVLQAVVQQESCAIGFAFDGDGDRVIAVDESGVVRDGDDILALLTAHYYRTYPEAQRAPLITTCMGNGGLDACAHAHGTTVVRTPVGDKHVAAALLSHHGIIGSEPSGHVLIADGYLRGDGLYTALRILEALTHGTTWSMSAFTRMPQIQRSIPVAKKLSLADEPYAGLLKAHTERINGRLIVRASGTEPIIRIMVECHDHATACMHADTITYELTQLVRTTLD